MIAFERSNDLGKYLGIPSLHGRVTNSIYSPILGRINSKLEGWKMKFLNFAGRQVLAQSILSTISYYVMQSTYLPDGIYDNIDKRIRNFL